MFFFILGTLWITSTTSSRDAVATPLKLSTRSLLIQGIAMTELDTKARPPSREDDAETRPEAQPRDAQPRLAVVTYNVWFDSLRYTERCDALFEILEASAADVICLQEVLPPFLQRLQAQAWVKRYAVASSILQRYGVAILARRDLRPAFATHKLPTTMGRTLLSVLLQVETACGRAEVRVGTVHLESLDEHPTRVAQLRICERVLGQRDRSAVLCGDFNFCAYRNYHPERVPLENECLQHVLPAWSDVWSELRSDPGFTFDGAANGCVTGAQRFRFDRVMCCGGHGALCPSAIELLGTRPVRDYLPPAHPFLSWAPGQKRHLLRHGGKKELSASETWPSDHFGLLAVFELAGWVGA